MEMAEGQQPIAEMASIAVTEIRNSKPLPNKHASKSERRQRILLLLREEIERKQSWKDVSELLEELAKVL